MYTLILSPRYTPDSNAIWKAAIAAGWNVERLHSWIWPEGLEIPENPVLYGEPLFNHAIAEQIGVRLAEPPINFLPSLDWRYTKRSIQLMPASVAARLKPKNPVFIKAPNEKSFAAKIYDNPEEILKIVDPDYQVLVADAVCWDLEVRFFILNNTIVASSPYSYDGDKLDDDWMYHYGKSWYMQDIVKFTLEFLSDSKNLVGLPDAYVLDVGIIEGNGVAIVEANEAQGAGIYGASPQAVLSVLPHTVIKKT